VGETKVGQNVFFILSYFCPNIIIRTKLDKSRTKFLSNFVPTFCPTFVIFFSYFCPSGFEIFLFCPSIFYKMFRICIFCPIFVLFLSYFCPFDRNFLSLFCPTFVPIFAENFHQCLSVLHRRRSLSFALQTFA
jgi:hypothetical protein